jgi:hypothetical protein
MTTTSAELDPVLMWYIRAAQIVLGWHDTEEADSAQAESLAIETENEKEKTK